MSKQHTIESLLTYYPIPISNLVLDGAMVFDGEPLFKAYYDFYSRDIDKQLYANLFSIFTKPTDPSIKIVIDYLQSNECYSVAKYNLTVGRGNPDIIKGIVAASLIKRTSMLAVIHKHSINYTNLIRVKNHIPCNHIIINGEEITPYQWSIYINTTNEPRKYGRVYYRKCWEMLEPGGDILVDEGRYARFYVKWFNLQKGLKRVEPYRWIRLEDPQSDYRLST